MVSNGKETAGPSTTLRSGRDDNSVVPVGAATANNLTPATEFVIPTGAKRIGGPAVSSRDSQPL